MMMMFQGAGQRPASTPAAHDFIDRRRLQTDVGPHHNLGLRCTGNSCRLDDEVQEQDWARADVLSRDGLAVETWVGRNVDFKHPPPLDLEQESSNLLETAEINDLVRVNNEHW